MLLPCIGGCCIIGCGCVHGNGHGWNCNCGAVAIDAAAGVDGVVVFCFSLVEIYLSLSG